MHLSELSFVDRPDKPDMGKGVVQRLTKGSPQQRVDVEKWIMVEIMRRTDYILVQFFDFHDFARSYANLPDLWSRTTVTMFKQKIDDLYEKLEQLRDSVQEFVNFASVVLRMIAVRVFRETQLERMMTHLEGEAADRIDIYLAFFTALEYHVFNEVEYYTTIMEEREAEHREVDLENVEPYAAPDNRPRQCEDLPEEEAMDVNGNGDSASSTRPEAETTSDADYRLFVDILKPVFRSIGSDLDRPMPAERQKTLEKVARQLRRMFSGNWPVCSPPQSGHEVWNPNSTPIVSAVHALASWSVSHYTNEAAMCPNVHKITCPEVRQAISSLDIKVELGTQSTKTHDSTGPKRT